MLQQKCLHVGCLSTLLHICAATEVQLTSAMGAGMVQRVPNTQLGMDAFYLLAVFVIWRMIYKQTLKLTLIYSKFFSHKFAYCLLTVD